MAAAAMLCVKESGSQGGEQIRSKASKHDQHMCQEHNTHIESMQLHLLSQDRKSPHEMPNPLYSGHAWALKQKDYSAHSWLLQDPDCMISTGAPALLVGTAQGSGTARPACQGPSGLA